MPKKPYVDETLLTHLKTVFPDRCPAIADPDRKIWMAVGAQEVIRHLEALLEQQVKEAMK
jgi:hypothetical protein